MSTLARQMAATGNKWSLTRSNQQADQLEAFFAALLGSGVVSGGKVATNGGLSVKVPSGTVLCSQGVTLTLGSDAIYNGCADNATNTLWGRILRTAANPANPGDSDTYALSLTSDTDDSSPGSDYFRLAKVTMLGGACIAIQNPCLGKFPEPLKVWGSVNRGNLLAGDQVYIGSTEQVVRKGPITAAAGAEIYVEAGGQLVIL